MNTYRIIIDINRNEFNDIYNFLEGHLMFGIAPIKRTFKIDDKLLIIKIHSKENNLSFS